MIQTTIECTDPTGQQATPDPDLRGRVMRAADLLKVELEPVDTFPIESRWQIIHQPGSVPRVELDLTSGGVGVRGWLFDTSDWDNDGHIRRSLRGLVTAFGQAISPNLRSEALKSLNDLKKFAAMPLFTVGE